MVPEHPCTAWCNDPTHVDLAHWVDDGWSQGEIAERWTIDYQRLGVAVRVTKIEPAPEAKDRPHGTAHLVWWERLS